MKAKVFIAGFILLHLSLHNVFAADKQEERFYIATKAFSDGFYGASISLFDRFIKEFPQSKKVNEARLYIAKCYYFKEDYPQALDVLNQLMQAEDSSGLRDKIYYWLAEIDMKGKDFTEALAYTNKIIKDYPDSKLKWWAYNLAATAHRELKDIQSAVDIYKKIIAEGKDKELVEKALSQLLNIYFQDKNYSEVVGWGEKYLKKFPQGSFKDKVYFYLGESSYAQGFYDTAIGYYTRAAKSSKDMRLRDLIQRGLGFAFLGKGDAEEAKIYINNIKEDELRIFSQGIYYFEQKDYLSALQKFDSFLERFPKSEHQPNAYLYKADALYELGRIKDSLSVYRDILDNFKYSQQPAVIEKAHYGLAWCYLKEGKFKKAIEEFKYTLKQTDNPIIKTSSQIQIADAYQEEGKYEEALGIYNDILKNNPNTIYADYIQFQIGMIFLKTQRLQEALLALSNLKKNFPASRLIPQVQYYLAVSYFSVGNWEEAGDLLQNFIKKYPQSSLLPEANYLLGKCFFNNNDYAGALAVFKKIMGKFKDKDMEELVYIDIGRTYYNTSSFNKAKKVWLNFLEKFPNSPHAHAVSLYLGGLYEKEENYSSAEKYYKRAVGSSGDSLEKSESFISLAHLYWQEDNLKKAEEYFKKAEELNTPLSLKAKLYLARMYAQRGRREEAFKIYDELIAASSEVSKAALLQKAILLKDEKNYPQAAVLFRKAIKEGVDNPEVRFSLGLCLEKMKRYKDAIEEYFNIIYLFKDNEYRLKAYFRIARIYEEEGDIKEAKSIYRKIIALGTEEAKIAEARLKKLE